ncbi:MAG: hypothetical protein E7005_03575 [Alphaproteobacteria bacterium]|nr:hypothetical protein [Alphaproteobacteria bacterium]
MLLYVNKKQERKKRIKLLSLIAFIIFFITANIINFYHKLHTTTDNLSSYQSITHLNTWYKNYEPIEIYKTKDNQIKVILIPNALTREITETLSTLLEKISKTPSPKIHFLGNASLFELIKELAQIHNIEITDKITKKSIIISSDFDLLKSHIYSNKLFPKTITYVNSTNPKSLSLLNKYFPLPISPKTNLSKQKHSLTLFAKAYQKELETISTTNNYNSQKFHKQSALLKNIPLCLQTTNSTFCTLDNKTSLIKNIIKTKEQNKANAPYTKLILLTNFEKTTLETFSPQNGLLFKFHSRETILLPNEKDKNHFYTIKQKSGINPNYETKDMEFYQFKTVEINLNDNI